MTYLLLFMKWYLWAGIGMTLFFTMAATFKSEVIDQKIIIAIEKKGLNFVTIFVFFICLFCWPVLIYKMVRK